MQCYYVRFRSTVCVAQAVSFLTTEYQYMAVFMVRTMVCIAL